MSKLFVLLLLSNEQHPQICILFLFKVFSGYVTEYVQMMPVSFLSENQKSHGLIKLFVLKSIVILVEERKLVETFLQV